jgi:hypothetical protein
MGNVQCHRCGSSVDCLNSCTSAPPWCPVCGADFKRAAAVAPADPPAKVAVRPAAAVAPAHRPVSSAHRPVAPAVPAEAPPHVEPPADLPPEVAALGAPEQVHAPDEAQVIRNRTYFSILAGCAALLLFAIAGFASYMAGRPLGPGAPPAEVLRGAGIGGVVLGALVVVFALWFRGSRWGESWWGGRTFLVYDQALVELRAGGFRIIPWNELDVPRDSDVMLLYYRFPVRGGKAVVFDSGVHDHKGLAAAIRRKSALDGTRAWLGDDAALAAMGVAPIGPSMLASILTGQTSGAYRITVLGDRLLFYRVKCPCLSPTPPPGSGGFNLWAYSAARRRFLEEMAELVCADAPTLLRHAADSDGSFIASAENVREIRLDPPSLGGQIFYGIDGTRQEAVLRLVHGVLGTITVGLLDREHVLAATQELPRLFGEAAHINVVWSHSACNYVGKP